jgi:hypothetical protein
MGGLSSHETISPEAPAALDNLAKILLERTNSKLTALKKDNDFIYHSTIPKTECLDPLDKLCAAQKLPISQIFGAPAADGTNKELERHIGKDLFENLIPLDVHESESVYSEKKAELLRGLSARCDQANEEMDVRFSSLGLPGALGRFKNPKAALSDLLEVPSDCRSLSDKIKAEEISEGGTADKLTLDEMLSSIDEAKDYVVCTLDKVLSMLEEEESEFEAYKVYSQRNVRISNMV